MLSTSVYYLLDDSNALFEQFLSLGAEELSTSFDHLEWALILHDLEVGNTGVDSLYQKA